MKSGPSSKLAADLKAAGLDPVAQDIQRLAKPSIRLVSTPDNKPPSQPGVSRLGGLPDLPDGAAWPVWKDVPMSFIAQIHLADIAAEDVEGTLSHDGRLAFFYDARQETYGADPADRGGWKVFAFSEQAPLKPAAAPDGLPAEARFTACSLSFSRELTLPSAPKQANPELSWTPDQIASYEAFISHYPSPQDRKALHHRMLGYPDQIQDDMQLECALASQGFHSLDEPGAAGAAQTKGEWQLLLQVDSDENAGMRWATYGMIYYWIRSVDLQARRFENTWLVLQAE